MILAVLAFFGGVVTILSPCILPVVPFVLARTEQPFTRSTLPLLIGMAATFAVISTLAAVGGAWAVHVNDYGRIVAMVLLSLSALALLSRRFGDWITRPVVALGARLSSGRSTATGAGVLASVLLGVATGLLWAPCAGPILGLVLTGAALRGPSVTTTVLLLAYALGAACSLALIAAASTRVIAAMKRSFAAGEWLRRILGAAVLVAVLAIALGWDTGVLTSLSETGTNHVEQALIDSLAPGTASAGARAMQGTMHGPTDAAMTGAMTGAVSGSNAGSATTGAGASASAAGADLPVEGELPSLAGAVQWLNSPPLTPQGLRGKVVMVDFWTYSCINCLRALPYVKSWYARYRDQGLVVIGVHAPEFAFEKNPVNVTRAVHDLGITYPVALDNNYAIWKAFNNEYWPAHYFIDAQGRIRGHHFGEGDYAQSEQLIRELLTEAGVPHLAGTAGHEVQGSGVQASADESDIDSPETYIGYERAQNFASPGALVHDEEHSFSAPERLRLNQWALSGVWKVDAERAMAVSAHDGILFRFHARDLHLVLGPPGPGHPVRFRVTIDGRAPGADHGSDVQSDGTGTVTEQRLYQLLRQSQPQSDHTFEIEFLDPGVQAYSFTFG
jgi:cytochrome c biogenesis protein CcdA/thiol-disulfide isomerase/thioredoxin